MKHSQNDSLWVIAGFAALLCIVVSVANYDEPQAKLGQEVKADVMMRLCFPQGIYTKSAHKYCQKFKEDLTEHMTIREKEVAEKCLRDNVNINKCVRVK